MLEISVVKAQDQKAATFIGYLNIIGPRDGISDTQYAALGQFLEKRRDYLLAIKAPNAEVDSKGAAAAGDYVSPEYIEWCQKARAAYAECQKAIYAAQNENRSENLWAAIDLCVIQGQHHHHMIGAVRVLGNVLAKHFRC